MRLSPETVHILHVVAWALGLADAVLVAVTLVFGSEHVPHEAQHTVRALKEAMPK